MANREGDSSVTIAKIEGKPAAAAAAGLEPWVAPLYATPSKRVIGVVELAHVLRTQPAPDADKEAEVRLRITHLEIARPEQEDALRQALLALHLHRTAYGTLNEDGELQLSESTLSLTAGQLHALEAARLRAAVAHWYSQCRRVLAVPEITVSEMRHELDTIADGLAAVLAATSNGDDGG
jgi:hypothetical protein